MPAGADTVYTLIEGGIYVFNADGTKLDFVGGSSEVLPRTFHDDVTVIGSKLELTGSCKLGRTNEFIKFDNANNNAINFYTGGTLEAQLDSGGNFHVDADVIAFSTTTSDSRLKTNIQPLAGSLDVICNLEGVTYDWKYREEKNQIGLIAQDVEKFIPESIKEGTKPFYGKDEKDTTIYKSINYDMIVPHLIESIKELKSEIDDLKSKLENK